VDLPPFQTLLDQHGQDVYRFLIATVGSNEADDCYQETWLAALRGYRRLRDSSNLRGWVLTIAYRKAIDHLRGQGRRAIPLAEPPEPSFEPELDGEAEIWARVRELPPKQRSALAMRFMADAAYSEISVAMGTSQEAARRNVHEGLTRLRKEYLP
jgi:RNA polymerase sigma factor (sigma-70 family)